MAGESHNARQRKLERRREQREIERLAEARRLRRRRWTRLIVTFAVTLVIYATIIFIWDPFGIGFRDPG